LGGQDGIQVEVEGQTAVLRFDRPETLNAVDFRLLLELEQCLNTLEEDRQVRVVIVTGEGRAFVAGGDVRYMRDLPATRGRQFIELGHRVLDRLAGSRLVSIAAINGYALGGGAELALACDLRVAAGDAKVGFPEVRLGLFPAWGGTQRLVRLVGPARARMLVFTAEILSANEALEFGLVDRVVQSSELMTACRELSAQIAQAAPRALEHAKRSILEGGGVTMDEGKRIEREEWLTNFETDDRVEGLSAFLEKRKPVWRDC
jgi:enoyl-CoA hydratase/carnithine racemase